MDEKIQNTLFIVVGTIFFLTIQLELIKLPALFSIYTATIGVGFIIHGFFEFWTKKQTIFCQKCGTKIVKDAEYCLECGEHLFQDI